MTENTQNNQPMDAVEKLDALSKKKKTKVFTVAAIVVILLATTLAYLPTLKNDFIYLDDDSHLLENPAVRVLDAEHIKHMFTTTVSGVYVPLTFLTFAFEHHLFKYTPFIYHLDNLLLHLAVTALVYYLALQIGLPLRAAFIAGLLFGIHPMHVESVSWITERKDVLYSFFYILALCAYWKYLSGGKKAPYVASVIFGVLSMLAKPMALSLPLVLFVFDWFKGRKLTLSMILDKIPHFLYAVGIAWITYRLNARIPGENVQSGAIIWIYTFVFYIRQFLLPLVLVPMYALPEPIVAMNVHYLVSAGLFLVIVGFLFRMRKNRWVMLAALYYFFSIFFLLRYDTVVDKNIVADRFMYLPCLGICFLLGYGIDRLYERIKGRGGLPVATVTILLLTAAGWLGVKTFTQTKVWRASIPFWSYVLQYYPENAMAYGNRGEAYRDQERYDLAMKDFNTSIIADPDYMESYNSRGQMYGMMGDTDAALADFKKVIELRPDFDEAYNNIGVIYSMQERPDEAIGYYEKAIKIDPFNDDALYNAGEYYYKEGEFDKAFESFQKIIEIDPASVVAYNKRGLLYGLQQKHDQALADFNRAIEINPLDSEIYKNKGVILEHQKEFDEAIENYNKAIELDPMFADAYCFRGNSYAQTGQYGVAAKDFAKALKIDPDHWRARQSQNALINILTGRKTGQNVDIQKVINDEQEKRRKISDIEKETEKLK